MKGDRVQAIGCPPGLVWRGRRHLGGVAYLLRLYIDCINVMLGVVTWTESNIGSIVFQTEVRGRGRVPRVPGKSLGVICSGSKAECFLFPLRLAWERPGFPQHLCSCLNSHPLNTLCSPQAWPLLCLLGEGRACGSLYWQHAKLQPWALQSAGPQALPLLTQAPWL